MAVRRRKEAEEEEEFKMAERIIEIASQVPVFITEGIHNGTFFEISGMRIDSNNNLQYLSKIPEHYLQLGLDIRETPTRGLTLYFEHVENYILASIAELRKLAQVSGNDYFSYEPIGGANLQSQGNGIIVRPRLFTKIVDN